MPTLTYLGETYECATAIKGADYIHLLDENGVMIATFDEITSFSGFKLTNGSYTSPTADMNCYLAIVRDDGTIGKGGHKCSDIPLSAADLGALPTVDATAAGNDMEAILKGGAHLAVYKTGVNTGGTPAAAGKTGLGYATILSYATSKERGMQIAFISGSNLVCVRRLYNGTVGDWGALYTENNKPTAEDIGAAKIATGSYTGTGIGGVNHPTSVTLPFEPKTLIVTPVRRQEVSHIDEDPMLHFLVWSKGLTESTGDYSRKYTQSGNTVSWYIANISEDGDTHQINQLNAKGSVYHYVAIG